MFTGIVEEVGVVRRVEAVRSDARRLSFGAERVLEGLEPGDSIAVDGVCQTVVTRGDGGFTVETIATTLSRTTLGALEAGREVNLERALALGDRLGGHLVQGHVDGLGTVGGIERQGQHVLLDLQLPEDVAEVTVLHGSIAVNGVSLTVNALPGPDLAQVALIPHTWKRTNLSRLSVGDAVNVEGDMLGRFVVEYLKRTGRSGVVPT